MFRSLRSVHYSANVNFEFISEFLKVYLAMLGLLSDLLNNLNCLHARSLMKIIKKTISVYQVISVNAEISNFKVINFEQVTRT